MTVLFDPSTPNMVHPPCPGHASKLTASAPRLGDVWMGLKVQMVILEIKKVEGYERGWRATALRHQRRSRSVSVTALDMGALLVGRSKALAPALVTWMLGTGLEGSVSGSTRLRFAITRSMTRSCRN